MTRTSAACERLFHVTVMRFVAATCFAMRADVRRRNAGRRSSRQWPVMRYSRLQEQADAPASLGEVLAGADAAKRRAVLRNLSIELIPIIEKGIVDPALSHR